MKEGKCYYYETGDKPEEHDEAVIWFDPEDGCTPFPEIATFMKGEWRVDDENHTLVPVKSEIDYKILLIQKLTFPHKLE